MDSGYELKGEGEVDDANEQRLNPWQSIWFKPRATIKRITEANPEYWVVRLVVANGFLWGLLFPDNYAITDYILNFFENTVGMPVFLAVIIVALLQGLIAFVLQLYILAFFINWTGNWIDGEGSLKNIRAAIGWSVVPLISVATFALITLLIFVGPSVLTPDSDGLVDKAMEEGGAVTVTLIGLAYLSIIIGFIWSAITFIKCLAQVQGFSAWKAIGNILLAYLMLVIIGVVIGIIGGVVSGFAIFSLGA